MSQPCVNSKEVVVGGERIEWKPRWSFNPPLSSPTIISTFASMLEQGKFKPEAKPGLVKLKPFFFDSLGWWIHAPIELNCTKSSIVHAVIWGKRGIHAFLHSKTFCVESKSVFRSECLLHRCNDAMSYINTMNVVWPTFHEMRFFFVDHADSGKRKLFSKMHHAKKKDKHAYY